jgi:hypothetical protein
MAWSNPTLTIGARCSDASITAGRIVTGDTTDTTNQRMVVKAATGETTQPLGITETLTDAADQNVTVVMQGIAECVVNGNSVNIDINDSIVATTGGIGVKISTLDDTPQLAIGYALAPSAADGDTIPVLIDRHHLTKGTA